MVNKRVINHDLLRKETYLRYHILILIWVLLISDNWEIE